LAAFYGNTNIVKLLLEHSANPSAKGFDGNAALKIAKRYGYKEIEKILREALSRNKSMSFFANN
jgi:ankyrin repeat protein